MKIDLTRKPPADIFRHRGTYIRISLVLLALVLCGGLLMVYGIVAAPPQSGTLETVILALFVGPAVVFVYVGEKLKGYKRLSPAQKEELAALGRQHPEIAAYCAQVAAAGREPILAEYEAAKDRADELARTASKK